MRTELAEVRPSTSSGLGIDEELIFNDVLITKEKKQNGTKSTK